MRTSRQDGTRPGLSPRPLLGATLRLLRQHARVAYGASAVVTLLNTVPDVLRKILVWTDPRFVDALGVAAVGFLTGLAAQLWLTGAFSEMAATGRLRRGRALGRGARVAVSACRATPRGVLAAVVAGGLVSAVLTLPASVAALGPGRLLGPLASPSVGAFAIAAISDAVASAVTLPFLALALVLAAGAAGAPGPAGVPAAPAGRRHP